MKLIVANWKNNPETADEAVDLVKAIDQPGLVICPPDKFVDGVGSYVKSGKLGAQDLFWEKEAPAKVEYVIVGHSDRRYGLGETNEVVAQKFAAAIDQKISPILCVGETLEEKQQGDRERVIEREIISAFKNLSTARYIPLDIYIAYEPIWAISTGSPSIPPFIKGVSEGRGIYQGGVRRGNSKSDNPENAITAILFIKGLLTGIVPRLTERIHFLYGGSINSDNAQQFLQHPEIEGTLVGQASLNPDEIKKILKIVK